MDLCLNFHSYTVIADLAFFISQPILNLFVFCLCSIAPKHSVYYTSQTCSYLLFVTCCGPPPPPPPALAIFISLS